MISSLKCKSLFVHLTFCLVILFGVADVLAGNISISWEAPSTSDDGSPISDLAGYNVYYGTESQNYTNFIDVGNVTAYQVNDLTDGETYYFAATAYDLSGNESAYSNEVVKQVAPPPPPPPAAEITVSDSADPADDLQILFGDVAEGDSSTHTVTVSNAGNINLIIGNIAGANPLDAPFGILNDNCSGQSIGPSESCTLTVRLSPTATGTFSDTFDIPSDDSDENPVTISVTGTGLSNTAPSAAAGGAYSVMEGDAVVFDGSASTDSDGSIVLYEWDVDSNGTFEYSSSSSTRSHIYDQQGTYTVTLRVTDNLGKTGAATASVAVTDTSPASDFEAALTSGTAPLTVTFVNNSSGYDQPLTYIWDFDNDGTPDSTVSSPSYTFEDAGTYTVSLTVTDADGSAKTLTRTNYITVTPSVYQLTVNVTGSGTVTSSSSGIQCPGDCSEQYSSGTVVTLTAASQPGEQFDGWTGCDSQSGSQCVLTINANTVVTAAFSVSEKNLSCTDGGEIECLERTDGGSDGNNLVNNKAKVDLTYKFQVVLQDTTGGTPQYMKLYMTQRVDPQSDEFYSYDMSCGGDYSAGAICTYETKLGPAAVHTFYFEAKTSEGDILRYPYEGYLTGPEIRLLQGYSLVGIPRDMDSGSLDCAAAFGSSTTYRWSTESGRYQKLTASELLKEGEGYFALKQMNTLPELKEYGEVTDIQFTYRLNPGWNIISNPYSGSVALENIQVRKGDNVPVTWTEATSAGWLTNAVYYATGKDWGNTYSFETAPEAEIIPWLGYWVYLEAADDIYYLVIQKPNI